MSSIKYFRFIFTGIILLWAQISFAELTPKMSRTIRKITNAAKCKPIITSGKRNPKDNARVGGSSKSQHLTGNAIDFVLPCRPLRVAAKIAKKYCRGIGIYKRHIHCDMRKGKKVIWYDTRK